MTKKPNDEQSGHVEGGTAQTAEQVLQSLVDEGELRKLRETLDAKNDFEIVQTLLRVAKVAFRCRPTTTLRVGDVVQPTNEGEFAWFRSGPGIIVEADFEQECPYAVFWLDEEMRAQRFVYDQVPLKPAKLSRKQKDSILRRLDKFCRPRKLKSPIPQAEQLATYDAAKTWLLAQPTPLFIVAKYLSRLRGVKVNYHDCSGEAMMVGARFSKLPMVKEMLKEHGYAPKRWPRLTRYPEHETFTRDLTCEDELPPEANTQPAPLSSLAKHLSRLKGVKATFYPAPEGAREKVRLNVRFAKVGRVKAVLKRHGYEMRWRPSPTPFSTPENRRFFIRLTARDGKWQSESLNPPLISTHSAFA